jgi:hypothetical protein
LLVALAVVLLNSLAAAAALYALSSACAHHLKLRPWIALSAGMTVLGVLGALQFWVMFLDVDLAGWMRAAVWIGLVVLLVFAGLRRSKTDLELLVPCLGLLAGTLALLAWTMSPVSSCGIEAVTGAGNLFRFMAGRWMPPLPGDNEIPYVFAEQLRAAQILKVFYGDWLSSDRPPLQTGLYLLLNLSGSGPTGYQVTSTALQLFALPAVWALCASMGATRLWSGLAMLALWATPLTFLHGVFVWPKLIAGAYLAITAALYFGPSDKERRTLVVALSAAAAALAMLSHGATAFAIVGLGIAALCVWRMPTLRQGLLATAVAGLLYLPWTAYQNTFDPPGNRLMKWHLAGSPDVDDRSLGETLSDQYGKLTLDSWIDGRVWNAQTIFTEPVQEAGRLIATGASPREVRTSAFYRVPFGLGLFAIGLYGLAAFLWLRQTRAVATGVAFSLGIWIVLAYEPGMTIPHAGSFFPQIAIVALLAAAFSLNRLASRAGLVLLGANCLLVGALHAAA